MEATPAPIVKASTSSMEPGISDILIRGRQTILDILEDRGYDVTNYRNIAPDQILALAESGGARTPLDIIVKKTPDSLAPCERAVVVYQISDRAIRGRLGTTFLRDLYDVDVGGITVTKKDDLIVLINEPYNEAFDKVAIQMWQTEKIRLTFFHIKQVVVHPGRHVLVPPHRKLTSDETKEALGMLRVKEKTQLPLIKHHDIQSRVMGLVPGDVVEILRPSPTAGVARFLRICSA
jgi:DNA-directed RNA polymerase subunit H (RpoH/RPB5)